MVPEIRSDKDVFHLSYYGCRSHQDGSDNGLIEQRRFSDEALALLDGFLDSFLFSILATARSRSLTTIRPAVQEVLKPRLAREAMKAADE
ncbi:hypothetical protein SLS55_006008 [Diplodia seriata]|uniref:Uncharacterized protein n=1 Tax=Diplodia seriata TaxID=420778 RepID=A0ABR3CD03_9PEZI